MAEAKTFLGLHYPLLGEITDSLEERGLKLIRFHQSERKGRLGGSLKFSGLPNDYILEFALQPSEVMLFRSDGKGGVIPIWLNKLSSEAVAKAIWDDTLRS